MRYDAIVIGTGQAAAPLATKLAKAGKRVLVIEKGSVGGTCVNVGCTPTKTMIASARAAHVARSAGRLGVHTGEVTIDFAAVVARKDAIVKRWREGVERHLREAGPNLTFIAGHARFVGEREIEVNGERHQADVIVLNTGARPTAPAIAGRDEVPWIDSTGALALRELPRHLIVVGGGYIGCELGQMFRRFGAEVTLVDHGQHLLSREDPDVSSAVEEALAAEGIARELGASIERVAKDGDGIAVHLGGGKVLRGSHLMLATGRRPNTDELGCDAAGIRLDAHGFIVIDDRYQTSAKGVYAVGDVTGQPQFTHVSWDDHRILLGILDGTGKRDRSGRLIPYTVFTDPQVAGVGLSETEAKKQGIAYELATYPMSWVARAIELDEQRGMLKVLVDPATERILGAIIVGIEAGELIHVYVTLMQAKASARVIVDAEMVHPTLAEGVQSVLMTLPRFS